MARRFKKCREDLKTGVVQLLPVVMGNSSSQSETSGATDLPELAREPVQLCGTLPTEEVPCRALCSTTMVRAGYDP